MTIIYRIQHHAHGRRFGHGLSVIGDVLPDMWNPADGKRYSSKRAYQKAVRAAGCEIVGNENIASVERNRPVMSRAGGEIARVYDELARKR